jgi:hypothetical protein
MKFEITYDPTLRDKAGFVQIDKTKLRDQDGQTLLYLLFWMLYTEDGRKLLKDNEPGTDGQLLPEQRANLVKKFAEYGVTSPDLQNAILDAHVAGHNWTVAFGAGQSQDTARALCEKVYLQKIAFILWCVWEDAKGHEFSLAW